ncbi:hypothetical protein HDU93_008248 [Gonapodya sp. JEL0774]|nr:hypothetical protein HDU93_008248 [Gonapodya sp. JEL0774]
MSNADGKSAGDSPQTLNPSPQGLTGENGLIYYHEYMQSIPENTALPPLPQEALMAPPNMAPPPTYEEAIQISNRGVPPPGMDMSKISPSVPSPQDAGSPSTPTNNAVMPPQGVGFTSQPPPYYDVSVVPKDSTLFGGFIMFQGQQPTFAGPSLVEIEHNSDGDVKTFSPLTATNAEALFHFFLTYADRPLVFVQICGTHTEHYTTVEHYTDSNGHHHTRHVQHTRTVTDFDFRMDVSNYFSPQWSSLVAVQSSPQVASRTIEEVLQEFTQSENKLKEIHMRKQARWDYDQLSPALVAAVRSTGYMGHVSVTFPTSRDKVTITLDSDAFAR